MQGNHPKDQHDAKVSRRKFLTKVGTGVVISALPAKSVWGACSVSGALSGNLSQSNDRHKCDEPRVVGGRSPGGWKNFENNEQLGKVKAFFSSATQSTKDCYLKHVSDVKDTFLPLPSELISGNITIRAGLELNGTGNNNIFFHLSAVYLNAYYGFYNGMKGQTYAEQLVRDIYTSWHVRNNILFLNDNVDRYFSYLEESSTTHVVSAC